MTKSGDINLKDEVAKSSVGKGLKVFFGFITVVILARYFSVSVLGQYFIAITLIEVSNQVCSGIAATVQKRCSESDSDEGEILTISAGLYIAYTALLSIPLYLLSGQIFSLLSIEFDIFVPVILGILTIGLYRITNNYISGIGYPGRAVFFTAGKNMVILFFTILFVLQGLGVYHIVLIESISGFIMILMMLFHKPISISYSYSTLVDIIRFSKWSVPNSILFILTHRVDVLVLAIFVGSSAVGLYQSAYKLLLPTLMLANAFSKPLIVKISNYHSRDLEFEQYANKIVSYAGILPIPLLFGAIALRDRVMILIFGSDFAGTGLILVLIAIYATVTVYRRQLIAIIYGIDRPDIVFKVQSIYFLINTPLSIYGAIEFGIIGVIIMTMLSEVITLLLYAYAQRNNLNLREISKNIRHQIYSSIIMLVSISPLVILTVGYPTFIDAPIIAIGGIIYFYALLKFSPNIRTFLKENISSLFN